MSSNISIYRHIFPNGKVYIGQTCRKPEKRWNNGKGYTSPFMFNAINKYGWDNIQHEILFTGLDQLNADIIEEDLIYYYKQIGKSYNLANGGSVNRGWKMSEEAKEKIRLSHLGEKNHNYGKSRSKETREKISKALKGKVNRFKRVEQIDKNTLEVIRAWDSLSEVERQLNISASSISKACKGKRKTAGGYKWRYKYDISNSGGI